MRIVNDAGEDVDIESLDLKAGRLVHGSAVKEHHEAVEYRPEEGHLEYTAFYFEDGSSYEVEGPDDPHVGPDGFVAVEGEDWPLGEPTGADQVWVVDSPQVDAQPAWDEYEQALVYRTYTDSEREQIAFQKVVRASVSVARTVAATLPDEQAAVVAVLFDEWDGGGAAYAEGDRVRYDGALYRCLQGHTSQEAWTPADASQEAWTPADAPRLWAEVLPGQSGEVGEWERLGATNPYMAGDRVAHGGKTWESTIDGNVWEPGAQGSEGLWREASGEE